MALLTSLRQLPQQGLNLLSDSVSRLDRYLIQQLCQPFGFGVGLFSALGVSVGVLFDLLRQVTEVQIPLSIALQILGLQLPYFVSLSLPMAMLLASLLTFARLSQDGELTALRACGVSLGRLIFATVLFGCLASGGMWLLTETVVPITQRQAQYLLQAPLDSGMAQFQPQQDIFYQEYGPDRQVHRFFYAREFDGQALRDLTLLDFTRPGSHQVISAASATWDAQTHTWTFRDGTIYGVTPAGTTQNVLTFREQRLQIPRDASALGVPPTAAALSAEQMRHYITLLHQQNETRQVRQYETRLQQKYALPLTPMLLAMIGSLLGIRPQRLTPSTGFGLSVGIVLIYYLLLFLGETLGNLDLLSPVWSAWLANAILGLCSIGLWLKLRR